MSSEEFEPKIIGFLCRWCSYTGADLAGISRIEYPASLSVIKTMCSGRVDPAFIVKAFADGADGVLVAGCHPGDCHYSVGNYKAMRRIPLLSKMLEEMGIEPERLRLDWISASEGEQFAELVNTFTNRLKELGPLDWEQRTEPLCERVGVQ